MYDGHFPFRYPDVSTLMKWMYWNGNKTYFELITGNKLLNYYEKRNKTQSNCLGPYKGKYADT